MDLADLISALSRTSGEGVAGPTRRITVDSRQVRPGDIFVAVCGHRFDGHDFIGEAVKAGAKIVVAQRSVQIPDSTELVTVEDSAEALGRLAGAAYGLSEQALTQLAVTGTNGKTTVACLTRAILKGAAIPCGLLGTIEYDLGGRIIPAEHTTPDALRLAELVSEMVSNGAGAVVMECSSHGLVQKRTAMMNFTAAALTNVSRDHLDYHGGVEDYLMAKSLLFERLDRDAVAVLNGHDPAGATMAQVTAARLWRYGLNTETELSGRIERLSLEGSQWTLCLHGKEMQVHSPLMGRYNVLNCLAAAGLSHAAGVGLEDITEGISRFQGVPGRLERIDCGQSFTVLVDYAHTDDALGSTLATLRELHEGRIIVVFGCGGERDRQKRPRMAAVAEAFADEIFLTNDNPRSEPPEKIIEQIMSGFSVEAARRVVREPDRRKAIERACHAAGCGELVLIAGKGHEQTQEIAGEKHPFDDRTVVRSILSSSPMEEHSRGPVSPTRVG